MDFKDEDKVVKLLLHDEATSTDIALTNAWGALLKDWLPLVWGGWASDLEIIEYSWRWYLYVWNSWRTASNNSYWPNHYQWSSAAWSAVNPLVSWAGLWSWVESGKRIKKIVISWGRRSNAEILDMQFAINHRYPNSSNSWQNWIDVTSEIVNDTIFKEDSFMNSTILWQLPLGWDMADMHSRTYDVDIEMPEDWFLDFCWKPIWTITATRFLYLTYKIYIN